MKVRRMYEEDEKEIWGESEGMVKDGSKGIGEEEVRSETKERLKPQNALVRAFSS